MKVNWKKAALGLVSGSALLALASCGGNGGSTDGSNADAGSGSDEKTITVSVGADYIDYINEVKSDFESENDVTINVVEMDMFDQMDALQLDGPAGKGPDVTMSPYDRVGQVGSQGHLAEMTLPDDGRYSDTDKQQVTIDDKIYGAPAMIEAVVMFYNKDLIDEAPATFSDLEELAKDDRFAEGDDNVGFLARWTDFYYTYGLLAGHGGYVFGDEGTDPSDLGLNNEGSVEAITYATDWFQNVWPQGMLDVSANENLMLDYFNQGKTAAIIYGPWGVNGFEEAGINYGVAKIPTLSNGNDYETFGGGKAWVVSNYSQNKDVSQQFVEYLTNEANQEKLYDMRHDIPANIMAQETVAASDDPVAKAVIEQYSVSQPMPNIPEMSEVWVGAENMLFDAGSGNMTPQEAADNAAKTIEEAIEQKY